MCLNTITKRFVPPSRKQRVAWKILYKDLFTCFKGTKLQRNWIEAEGFSLYTEKTYQRYQAGFHCYKTKNEARIALNVFIRTGGAYRQNWKIFKVLVKDITYEGTDGSSGPKDKTLTKLRNVVALKIKLASK